MQTSGDLSAFSALATAFFVDQCDTASQVKNVQEIQCSLSTAMPKVFSLDSL